MSDRTISLEAATQIAKDGVVKALREARLLSAKLARAAAYDIEDRGDTVSGPDALRAFAASLEKIGNEH